MSYDNNDPLVEFERFQKLEEFNRIKEQLENIKISFNESKIDGK